MWSSDERSIKKELGGIRVKNTLGDLNNHLFAELERLSDEALTGDELRQEIKRADSIAKVAEKVIDNASLVLRAEQFKDDRMDAHGELPKMLGE